MSRDFESLDLLAAADPQGVLSVGAVSSLVKSTLERAFPEPLWVSGEISNFRGPNAAGHSYFKLKDEEAVLEAVVWRGNQQRIPFALEDGLAVLARGRLQVYKPHGKYQLVVEEMRPAGQGDLYRRLEALKKKLEAAGYFSLQRKRPLPFLPQRIALVTSPGGAVLRDIVQILGRRFPHLEVVLFPAKVQGTGAAQEIARAIAWAGAMAPSCDLCLLARGGGSIEDLWAFNEEAVAEAIYRCPIPLVSAVGHQTDFTVADFVADLRAPTPSAAAELIVPDEAALRREIAGRGRRVLDHLQRVRQRWRGEWLGVATRPLLRYPQRLLDRPRQDCDRLWGGLADGVERQFGAARYAAGNLERRLLLADPRAAWPARGAAFRSLARAFLAAGRTALARQRQPVEELGAALQHLNPLSVLARGYSITTDAAGRLIRRTSQVEVGEPLSVQLSRGRLGVRVEKKEGESR